MGKLETNEIERFMDGELSLSQAERIALMVKASPESQSYLDHNRRLGDLIRMSNEEQIKNVSFDGLADRVLSEIGQSENKLPFLTRVNIWFREFFEHRRAIWVPAAALSAAAVLALLILPVAQAPQANFNQPGDTGIQLHSTVTELSGSRIASVDFGAAAGKTYTLQKASGGTVGVVWINETP